MAIEEIYNKYLEASAEESYVGIFLWYLQKTEIIIKREYL